VAVIQQKINTAENKLCNSKMIMSCISKVEMSGLRSAKLPVFGRRQDGGKGHYHGKAKGTEEIARDSQST
jgi:hypothetical protein